jgi:Hypothetical glycosyl hydrolase family 15
MGVSRRDADKLSSFQAEDTSAEHEGIGDSGGTQAAARAGGRGRVAQPTPQEEPTADQLYRGQMAHKRSVLGRYVGRRSFLVGTAIGLALVSTVLVTVTPLRDWITLGWGAHRANSSMQRPWPTPQPTIATTYGGLPTTLDNIHVAQIFNYSIDNLRDEADKVGYVWGSRSPDQPPGVYNTYYYLYDLEGQDGHDLAWFKAYHPDWIEYRCNRTTPAWEFYDTTDVSLDITNPAVLDYIWSSYLAPALQDGYAGIAFDNVTLENNGSWSGQRCGHYDSSGHWVQQFTGTANDPAYRQAVKTWAKKMYTRIHAAFPNATVSMNFSFDVNYPADSYALYQDMDIDTDERGFTNFGRGGDNYITDSTWIANMQALQYLIAIGKGLISVNQEPEDFAHLSNDEVQWVLANYLLVKGRYSYVFMSGYQEYGQLLIRPEYGAQIGRAAGPLIASQQVYMRRYTNGLAIVNPSSTTAYTVHLPANTYVDLYGNGLTSGTVVMPAHSGMVLLRV